MKSREIEKSILHTCQNTFKTFGHDELSSVIVTTLFLSPEELSMEELAKKTHYSLPSISLKMKQIVQNPAMGIERITKPGSKKVYYYMEKDILKLNVKRVKILHEKMIRGLYNQLVPLSKEYKKTAKTEEYKKKSRIVEQYLQDLKCIEEAFSAFDSKVNELLQKRNNK